MRYEMNEYSKALKDPRWQKKRLEILQRDDFSCTFCGSDCEELQIHHIVYDFSIDPWEYKNESLTTLCKSCHDSITKELKIHSSIMRKNILFSPYLDCLSILHESIDKVVDMYKVMLNFKLALKLLKFAESKGIKVYGGT